jgi:hypothetical protein
MHVAARSEEVLRRKRKAQEVDTNVAETNVNEQVLPSRLHLIANLCGFS